MSHFSSVNHSPSPESLIRYLDKAAAGLTAMKHYVAAAASRAVGTGPVLDIGCGAGHDLALLATAGLEPIGIDPSASMLSAARGRLGPGAGSARLVQADGAALPFRSGFAAGCRMERVLIHVESPGLVVSEIARVVRSGGFIALFEPDWSTLEFGGADPDHEVIARSVVTVRHPHIGGQLDQLVEAHGFRVLDRVSEVSFGYRIADFPLQLEVQLRRAVESDRIESLLASQWYERQVALDRIGEFRASWTKVLVVGDRRP